MLSRLSKSFIHRAGLPYKQSFNQIPPDFKHIHDPPPHRTNFRRVCLVDSRRLTAGGCLKTEYNDHGSTLPVTVTPLLDCTTTGSLKS
jgi:hypothetical protein